MQKEDNPRDTSGLIELKVSSTSNRNFEKEYIAQLNGTVLREKLSDTSEGDFIQIRNSNELETEIHARVQRNEEIDDDSIGLDFTLRTALGAPSKRELKHGGAKQVNQVSVAEMSNPESRVHRRRLNKELGVRPQICRVRMGVFPDLEDKVCRLPKNTMQMIGVEEGDNVTLESTRGERIVRGVKAFEIDDERRETKETQKQLDSERYPPCEEILGLSRIRQTEVDVPEIWIDEEVRSQLGLSELPKSGVCQPVRVYRDTWYLFKQKLNQFAIPLIAVLFTAGFEIQRQTVTLILWITAALLWIFVVLVESRARLD